MYWNKRTQEGFIPKIVSLNQLCHLLTLTLCLLFLRQKHKNTTALCLLHKYLLLLGLTWTYFRSIRSWRFYNGLLKVWCLLNLWGLNNFYRKLELLFLGFTLRREIFVWIYFCELFFLTFCVDLLIYFRELANGGFFARIYFREC